jgi:hypothetical protein
MVENKKRTTVYLNPHHHRALRLKSAETDRSISDLIDESLHLYLAEDEADLQAFHDRAAEPVISYEALLQALKADGKL